MNQEKFTSFVNQLHSAISETALTLLAKSTGFCERLRNIPASQFIVSLITSMASRQVETVADLQRQYSEHSGQQISYRAAYNQLSKEAFPVFAREVLVHLMNHLVNQSLSFSKTDKLSRFTHVFIQDGSSFALKDSLSGTFPGRFKEVSPSAIEIHVTMDLLADQPCSVSISPDTTGEREFLPAPSDLIDCLMLIDRGYFDLNWFDEVNSHQGYYIARCRNNVNPVVDEAWREDGKALKHVKGKCLKDVADKLLKRQRVEFKVHWKDDGKRKIKARLIAFWNADEKCYTWLITNLPRKEFTLDEVSETYRLRWQIELLFKEWKSYANLHKFNTGNPWLAEGLIWISIAASMLKRFLSSKVQYLFDIAISTRKVSMCCTGYFVQMMMGLIVDDRLKVEQNALMLMTFLGKNARRSHPKRDAKKGRAKMGLKPMATS